MKAAEETAALNALTAQLAKANKELQDKLKALNDQIENADVPDAVVTALGNLTTAAQGLDDIIPDAPAPTPTPEPPAP